jgi:two-component system sensor histidine kinase KdpD
MGASDNLLTENDKLSTDNKKNLIREINIASERLNKLVGDLLNISRIESGFIKPKLDWCDLRELIHNVVNRFGEDTRHHPVRIIVHDNLPLFKLDFGLMEQAIYNIFHNGINHTPEGTEITISADLHHKMCRIVISDTGPGITEEDRQRIFDKFYRSNSSKSGGLGLGLSIAKGFIEAHNGKLTVDNQPGGGARFTVLIPAGTYFQNTDENE